MGHGREVPGPSGTRFSLIEFVEVTGSTNSDLVERARAGALPGLVRVTDHQRSGRGRQGRTWHDSPQSSLLMSVLLRPDTDVAAMLPLAFGLAVADAVRHLAGGGAAVADVGLKWPNDVVVSVDDGERKLAGILAEAVTTPGGLAVVVGLGLNIELGQRWRANVPAAVADRAVDLDSIAARRPIERDQLVDTVLSSVDRRLDQLEADAGSLLADYRVVCRSIGRVVSLDHPTGVVNGTVTGIGDGGELIVATEAGKRRFNAGEVHHR